MHRFARPPLSWRVRGVFRREASRLADITGPMVSKSRITKNGGASYAPKPIMFHQRRAWAIQKGILDAIRSEEPKPIETAICGGISNLLLKSTL